MENIEDYKWYSTDRTALQPERLAKRIYYTQEEYEILCKTSKQVMIPIPKGDNFITRELKQLLNEVNS